MASEAAEFLDAWSLARVEKNPLTRADAESLSAIWEGDAMQNGIDGAELQEAAGGDLAAYLLKLFGDADIGAEIPPPAA